MPLQRAPGAIQFLQQGNWCFLGNEKQKRKRPYKTTIKNTKTSLGRSCKADSFSGNEHKHQFRMQGAAEKSMQGLNTSLDTFPVLNGSHKLVFQLLRVLCFIKDLALSGSSILVTPQKIMYFSSPQKLYRKQIKKCKINQGELVSNINASCHKGTKL